MVSQGQQLLGEESLLEPGSHGLGSAQQPRALELTILVWELPSSLRSPEEASLSWCPPAPPLTSSLPPAKYIVSVMFQPHFYLGYKIITIIVL